MLNIGALVKGYNESARGYNELLPWMCLWDEATVATTDQGLLAVYTYDGIDAEGKLPVETDAAVNAFEGAFSGFGSGNIVWSHVDRRRTKVYPGGEFGDPVAGFVDERWRENVTRAQYQNHYSMSVHQRSAEGANAFFDTVDMIIKEQNVGVFTALQRAIAAQLSLKARERLDERRMLTAYDRLEARLAEVEQSMARLGLTRLTGENLLSYLHARANPASAGHGGIGLPRIPAYLNSMLANDQVTRLPRALRFTNDRTKFVGVVSLKGWPDDDSFPGRLDYLTGIDGEVTVSHCFRFVDRAVAEKAIGSIERYNQSKAVPFFHRLMTTLAKSEATKYNPGRLRLAEDANEALEEIYKHNRAFGYHNLTMLCYGDTEEEMEYVREQVHTRLRESSFIGFTERMHQLTAFTQTLPGQWGSSVRWMNVSFGNVSDLVPIRTLYSGPTTCSHLTSERRRETPALVSLPTDSGVSFFWDPFESGAAHTLIIGPTRSGKSVMVNFLLSQFRKYEPCRTVVFDKDYTCRVPTLMQGGEHYDLSPDASGAMKMAPLALAGDSKHHAFLVRWVCQMIKLGRPHQPLEPEEIEAVTDAVRGLQSVAPEHRTLGSLRSGLGVSLGAYLDQWVAGGARAHWFDNRPTAVDLGNHICFEMKRLFDDEEVALLAMDYLFHIVEQRLDDTPTIIYVEETWFFLRRPEFVARLDDYIRTLAKRNAALWMTSQGAREFLASSTLKTMVQNIPNRIYLPNDRILQNAAEYIDEMGLSETQVNRIQAAEPKRDYYVVTPSMARMCHVALPEELVAVMSSSGRARATFERHYQSRRSNHAWKEAYMEEMVNA